MGIKHAPELAPLYTRVLSTSLAAAALSKLAAHRLTCHSFSGRHSLLGESRDVKTSDRVPDSDLIAANQSLSALSDPSSSTAARMWKGAQTFASFSKFLGNVLFRGWQGDGREEKLLEYVLKNAEQGNPQSVLQTVDDFAQSGTWFMNIGIAKGHILDAALAEKNPEFVLELGTYCGYSALRMAVQLKNPDSKIISLELMPHIAEIARQIINHAGLSDKVEVLMAPLSDRIQDLKSILSSRNKESFDFVFVDHDKDLYLPDYLLLKEHCLIGEGAIVFADNMGFPGSPKFWSYLKKNPRELETKIHKSNVEYISWIPDTVTVSTFHKN